MLSKTTLFKYFDRPQRLGNVFLEIMRKRTNHHLSLLHLLSAHSCFDNVLWNHISKL